MNAIKRIIVVLLIVLAVFFGFRILTPEDTWICKEGEWIKHGQPKTAMPMAECIK